jgi:hypothetical protein
VKIPATMDFEEIAAALVEDGDIKRKVKATECLIQFLVEQIPSDREFSFANTAVSTIDLEAGREMNIVCLTVEGHEKQDPNCVRGTCQRR